MQHSEISLWERLLAAGSYLTLGLVGFVWILINHFVIKSEPSRFLNCNLFQSFMISIIFAVLSMAYKIFIGLLIAIPFLGKLFYMLHVFIFMTPIFHTLTLANFVVFVVLVYLSVFALLGTLPFIPYITKIVKNF